jgi:hypothetical protein
MYANLYLLLIQSIVYIHMSIIKTANKPVHLRITSYDELNTTGIGLKNQGSKSMYVNLYLLLNYIIV